MHGECGTLSESPILPGRARQTADFGPKTALKIVDKVRDAIKSGKVKTSDDLRAQLKVGLALVREGWGPGRVLVVLRQVNGTSNG